MRIGSWILAGIRGLALAGVLFVSAESVTRLDDAYTWGAPLFAPYNHDRLLVRDSLGTHGRPNYRFGKWRMNNLGFRGPDIDPLPTPGRTRVVVLGASETFGLFESPGREYPARLQQLLDSVAPGRFEIVNAGLPGLSLSSMVPYVERIVSPLKPGILLVYPSPSFYLEVTPPPLTYSPPAAGPILKEGRAGFDSRLLEKSRDVLKELVPPVVVGLVRERTLETIRRAHPADWVWTSVPHARLEIIAYHLQQLLPALHATGARVFLVTHTTRFAGASTESVRRDRRYLVNLQALYYPQASDHVLLSVDSVANTLMRQKAAESGAGIVEVEGRIPPGSEYFADYAHFTDAGADRMARLLAERLLEAASP